MSERRPATRQQLTSGVRQRVARRPLTAFLVILFGVGWPVLTVPLLADRGLISTGALPAELFALGVTWFVMLPAALWLTAVSEGRGAARDLLRRLLRWRLGAWWAVILLALPATTVGVGLLLGGSVGTDDTAANPLQGVVLLVSAVGLIHLWEETVWAGFVQTRLERRHSLVVAALATAVPFSAIHVPIILIGESQVLMALGGVLVLGVAMRLLVGVFLRGTGGSLLAAGTVHGVYNACNNNGALVDGLLRGADQNLAAPIALVLTTSAAAAVIHRRSREGSTATGPGVTPEGTRQTPATHRREEHHGRPASSSGPVPGDAPRPRPANKGETSSVGRTAPTCGQRSGMGAAPPGATIANRPTREPTRSRTDAIVAIAALTAVLVAVTALVVTGTMGHFLGWAWERHSNVLSWYIRPLFVLPLALFSYRRSLAGIALTLIAMATSMFWFPAPAHVDPMIAEFLAFERQWLTSGWTPDKIAQALMAPVALFALCLVFWRRSLVLGLVVINAMALGKVAWGVIEGDGTGWAMQVPAVVGLALCDAAVLYAMTRLRRRAARTHQHTPPVSWPETV